MTERIRLILTQREYDIVMDALLMLEQSPICSEEEAFDPDP